MKPWGAGLVLVGLAWLTFLRVPVWRSDDTLWGTTARQLPGNVRVLINWHARQLAHFDIDGHFRTCDTLRLALTHGEVDDRERWIIDRICLVR